jgi:peptidoglycan biosynthesis protein MviN/MurJ (putative lipid II flippase)
MKLKGVFSLEDKQIIIYLITVSMYVLFLLPVVLNGFLAKKQGKDAIRYSLLSLIPFLGFFLIFYLLSSSETRETVFQFFMSLFCMFLGLLLFKTSGFGDSYRLWGLTAGCLFIGVGIFKSWRADSGENQQNQEKNFIVA